MISLSDLIENQCRITAFLKYNIEGTEYIGLYIAWLSTTPYPLVVPMFKKITNVFLCFFQRTDH